MEIKKIIEKITDIKILAGPFQGGQKEVYKCEINGKENALKFIKSTVAGDEGEIRCEREINTLSICNSKHLIKLGEIPYTEVSEGSNHIVYYSEEWVQGYELYSLLSGNNLLSEEFAKKLAIEISFAIEELWKHNKIHRDIKPLNIMYDECNDRFVLLDLGMVFDSAEDALTRYGCIPGTVGYFSPEQFDLSRKNDLDFRSDLFCLGIVLYQMLTGIHPFIKKGDTNQDVFTKIKTLTPPSIREYRSDISMEFEKVIFRLLRKRPSERYRNTKLLRDAITGGQ